jgi:hypothetical protein
MKKILAAVLMIAGFATAAEAKMKAKAKSGVSYYQNTNIDHRYDGAASDVWAYKAQSPAPGVNFAAGAMPTQGGGTVAGRTFFYAYPLSNFTKYGTQAASMTAAYDGQYAPSWDGPERNRARNIRAYNESEPLPSNAGSKQ